MNIQELTDIKTTINWLLENGTFEDSETSYNIAMNSINIVEGAINFIPCCVNKDLDKHPIEGVNEFMQVDTELEEIQLCGKSNCTRQKLEGNVYCSYHYDINFG